MCVCVCVCISATKDAPAPPKQRTKQRDLLNIIRRQIIHKIHGRQYRRHIRSSRQRCSYAPDLRTAPPKVRF